MLSMYGARRHHHSAAIPGGSSDREQVPAAASATTMLQGVLHCSTWRWSKVVQVGKSPLCSTTPLGVWGVERQGGGENQVEQNRRGRPTSLDQRSGPSPTLWPWQAQAQCRHPAAPNMSCCTRVPHRHFEVRQRWGGEAEFRPTIHLLLGGCCGRWGKAAVENEVRQNPPNRPRPPR